MRWYSSLILCSLLACSPKKEEVKQEPQPAAAPGATVIEVPDLTISTARADIAKGEELFASKGCIACHKIGGGKLVGPDLKGVTARRDVKWIEKMILRPDVMIKEDEVAKKLFVEHLTPMPNQNVDPQNELPLLLAWLKDNE